MFLKIWDLLSRTWGRLRHRSCPQEMILELQVPDEILRPPCQEAALKFERANAAK